MCPQLSYLETIFSNRNNCYRCDNIVISHSWIHLWPVYLGNIVHQVQKNVSNLLFLVVWGLILFLQLV